LERKLHINPFGQSRFGLDTVEMNNLISIKWRYFNNFGQFKVTEKKQSNSWFDVGTNKQLIATNTTRFSPVVIWQYNGKIQLAAGILQ
jgi:hypothetical protein